MTVRALSQKIEAIEAEIDRNPDCVDGALMDQLDELRADLNAALIAERVS